MLKHEIHKQFELVVIFPNYALRISLGTFSILLSVLIIAETTKLTIIIQFQNITYNYKKWNK